MSEKDNLPTVLIVDDTPANLGVVVEFLEENGFRVLVAQDGKEGLQRAAFIMPDLILLDVMMPGMDGFETCRQLKACIATRDIPVIFMTALADTASKLDGFKAGGVDYITKPLAIEEMLARVMTHIALRTTQLRLDQQNQRLLKEAQVRQLAESTLQETHNELKSVYKRLEGAKIQLLQATKMASIGMLARSAAQRITDPAASLKDHLHKIHEHLQGSAQELEALQLIDESMHDLDQLEECSHTFADICSQDDTAWQSGSVAHLLDNTIHMMVGEFNTQVKITKDYGDVPDVECRPIDLMQVFVSLLRNAALAIPEGGEIGISTGCDNQQIWIDIKDNGVGIEPENLNRIFDPFFSTRPKGKGAGLGLSLSFAAIKKHHGQIEVSSEPNAGSRFRVRLPLRQPANA